MLRAIKFKIDRKVRKICFLNFFIWTMVAVAFPLCAASVSSNYITVYGDNTTGIFGIGTSPTYALPNATLTFAFPGPSGTSHITLMINGTAYDYGGGTTTVPMAAVGSGLGAYDEMTKSFVSGVLATVHYEIVNNPMTGSLPDTAMLQFAVTNGGASPATIGLRIEIDTEVNLVDGANLSITNGLSTIPVQTLYRSSAGTIPAEWWDYDVPPPGIANLVGHGAVYNNPYDAPATKPDAWEGAYWWNVNSAGQWSTGALGSPIFDSAVVYWWTGTGDESNGSIVLAPSQSATFITYYGINEIPLVSTPTITPTSTSTMTPTTTWTNTPTNTPTVTPTSTASNTATNTATPTCEVHVWPDPYNPALAVGNTLRINCMYANTKVDIFTISGELVQTLDPSTACTVASTWGMVYCWNGRNKANYPVATGLYFYVVREGDKVIQRGKFLVVNTS